MEEKKTEKLQKKTNIRIICFALLFSLSVSVFAVVQDYFWCRSDHLPNNVFLFDRDLSGAGFEQAERTIQDEIKNRGDDVLLLTYRDQCFRYSLVEMGFPLDGTVLFQKAKELGRTGNLWDRLSFRFRALWDTVALEDYLEIDRSALEQILCSLRGQLQTTAKDASFAVSEEGDISLVPSERGTYLNKDKTTDRLISAMRDPQITTVALVIDADAEPSVTTEDLEEMRINSEIATFTTYYSESSANRSHNIMQAVSFINGTILLAGESFSFNDRVGERTYERGFLDAPIIENGRYREGIGGGVCQVSTTLYGAVLRTEMKVTSRRPHSLVSNYVPPGQDAMVSWNLSDLVFVNTYQTPVFLYARCKGGELTVSIYGDGKDRKDIAVDSEIIRYIPYKTEKVIDPDLPKGSYYIRSSGKRGLECSVIRTISQNGVVLKTETISHDIYAAQKEVMVSAP